MTTKLHINISQGVIDIEGDPELVREIYNDFKNQLLNSSRPSSPPLIVNEQPAEDPGGKPKAKRRSAQRKKSNGGSEEVLSTVMADSPKLDKSLDTSELQVFYDRYDATNNPEKILVFLKFLTEELNIASPNTDQFYTCFEHVNVPVPKVFSQAFRDASGRRFGFIDYLSSTSIKITTVGSNYFKFKLKKKASA